LKTYFCSCGQNIANSGIYQDEQNSPRCQIIEQTSVKEQTYLHEDKVLRKGLKSQF